MNARKALADWLDQRAAARAAQKRPPREARPVEAVEAEMVALPEKEAEVHEDLRHTLHRALNRRPVLASEEPAEAAIIEERAAENAVEADVKVNAEAMGLLENESGTAMARSFADLWQAMSEPASVSQRELATEAPAQRFELIRGSNESGIPSGMHDDATLRRLILAGKPFSGFIVFIGVRDSNGRLGSDKDLLRTIEIFISRQLGENEFGCRYGADEFVILCPGKHGNDAQRRLTAISERLWDYQLREAGRFAVVFSWGSAEIHHQSLGSGIAEAAELMQETRRTRRLVSLDMLRSQPRAAAI